MSTLIALFGNNLTTLGFHISSAVVAFTHKCNAETALANQAKETLAKYGRLFEPAIPLWEKLIQQATEDMDKKGAE